MDKEVEGKGQTAYLKPTLTKRQIMLNNFIGGLFWALGSVIGLAIIATVVGVILNVVDFNLILGDWLGNIIKQAFNQFNTTSK